MTIAAYQTLYESSIAFGMRKALMAEQRKAELETEIKNLETETKDLERQVQELRKVAATREVLVVLDGGLCLHQRISVSDA